MSGRATALTRARMIRRVMLKHGVPEVSIELQEGRPTSGDTWNSLDAVAHFSHHIASVPTVARPTPGLALVKSGRSDLPGPLANGTAGVDLVYRILTLGLANHPGFGGPLTVRGPLGAFTIPKDNARAYAWGTEYEGGYSDAVWDATYTNKRTGKSMTFREFMGRCNAALAEAIWLDGVSSRGRYAKITPGMDLSGYTGEHKTWAPGRKPDRLNYSTDSGRAEVRRWNTYTEGDPSIVDAKTKTYLDEQFDKTREVVVARSQIELRRAAAQDKRLRNLIKARTGASDSKIDEIMAELVDESAQD